VQDVQIEGNLGNGVQISGGDSSASTFITVDSSLNGGWGFNDTSAFGCTFVGCHTRDNGQVTAENGGYRSDTTSVFIGCYTEAGQGNNEISGESLNIRANGVGENAEGGTAPLLSATASLLFNRNGGYRAPFGTDKLEVAPSTNRAFYIGGRDDLSGALTLNWDETDKEYQWRYGSAGTSGTDGVYAIPTEDADRGVAGYVRVQTGLLVGAPGSAITQDRGTAAPASGTWKRGDIRFNSQPSAGGPAGWMCVTAGTPGTWKAMANLAA
jgi:hypothetical protein